MAGITGQGTTFNLPNYTNELFRLTPADTPVLSAIGGLTGGKGSNTPVFTWQTYDLRAAAVNRQRLEGANAPTAEARVRANVRNVLEIHQEALEVSYTKQAAVGLIAGSGSSHPHGGSSPGANPVTNEIDWQLAQHIIQIARDVELTFLTGAFVEPADNATARQTRGLVNAITTNVVDAGTAAPLTKAHVLDLMQAVWTSGGIMVDETRTLICNGFQKRKLTELFISDAVYQQDSRTVGGVRVDTILTDFGTVNVMLDRHMPAGTIVVASLEQLTPVFMEIPGKGHFFVEPLSKAGAADRFQLYGEIGLEYGNEQAHGKIIDLAIA